MTKVAKVYWALTFIVGTVLTIAVNAAHAGGVLASPGTKTAMVVAGCPPFVFAVVTEGYFLVRRSVPKRAQWVVKFSAGVLAAAAFAVSYETSRLFVIAEPGPLPMWTGWVIPGMVDTLVAVSGYVLYVLAEHGAAEDREVRRPSRWARIGDNIGKRVEVFTQVKEPQVDEFVNHHEEVPEPVVNSAEHLHEPFVKPVVKVPEPVVKRPAKPKPEVREPVVSPELEPFIPAAKWMLERREVTRKTETEVAEIVRLIASGASSYEIRKQLGGSTATYDKVTQAWQQWRDQQPAAALDHAAVADRQLTAVG